MIYTTYVEPKLELKDVGKLHGIDEMREMVKNVAGKMEYSRFLGFDVTIDQENNPRIIEINTFDAEVLGPQMTTGPIFGKFTEEVINYCLKYKYKNY